MVVTNSEYDKCGSAQPLFFSNNGDTTFVLDRPGLFYFISGVTGHCPKGQKMIVKVLDVENSSDDDQQSGNQTAAEDTKKKSDATQVLGHWSLPSFMVLFIVGYHIMG
ncbi:early nodulin-like protein 21 [Beta vulgaris subsp. vulgaris]|uniref:early nodulin-like protein 21 n=1 Tax=Beta vulgaris subsp. vulgaris TaxID=3555 RepID=UPI002036751E|nr:early nodulin-like protein 21 [Beta vulgaris subsp. vulgaris]